MPTQLRRIPPKNIGRFLLALFPAYQGLSFGTRTNEAASAKTVLAGYWVKIWKLWRPLTPRLRRPQIIVSR